MNVHFYIANFGFFLFLLNFDNKKSVAIKLSIEKIIKEVLSLLLFISLEIHEKSLKNVNFEILFSGT